MSCEYSFATKTRQNPIKCSNKADWEVGFCDLVLNNTHNDTKVITFTMVFCEEHFKKLNGCTNALCYREVSEIEWIDWKERKK